MPYSVHFVALAASSLFPWTRNIPKAKNPTPPGRYMYIYVVSRQFTTANFNCHCQDKDGIIKKQRGRLHTRSSSRSPTSGRSVVPTRGHHWLLYGGGFLCDCSVIGRLGYHRLSDYGPGDQALHYLRLFAWVFTGRQTMVRQHVNRCNHFNIVLQFHCKNLKTQRYWK